MCISILILLPHLHISSKWFDSFSLPPFMLHVWPYLYPSTFDHANNIWCKIQVTHFFLKQSTSASIYALSFSLSYTLSGTNINLSGFTNKLTWLRETTKENLSRNLNRCWITYNLWRIRSKTFDQSLCKSDEYWVKSVLYTNNTLANYSLWESIYEVRLS